MSLAIVRFRVAVVALLVAFVVSACGDDTSTTDAGQAVTFGNGEIPSTVPKDFPVPDGGVIGDTLVDRINHKTEFSVQVGLDLTSTVQFYDLGLVSAGYVVTSSDSISNQLWRIEFNQGELVGQVTVNSLGGPVSQVVVTLNVA
ncbi:MAG TPA: hypothetical protein VJP05_06920 [Acidimicrobiia bacterium]|nr:hypothetical protein [Acidimicrobiia bacterium]